jgi:hypothetical protein
LVSAVFASFLLKVMKNEEIEELNERRIITAQDMAVFAVMAIEAFQYISLGIVPNDYSNFIIKLSHYCGVNFNGLLSFQKLAY